MRAAGSSFRLLIAAALAMAAIVPAADARGGQTTIRAGQGATGVWQRLLKLSTTASVMHTTAHPDDEHAGLLTYLSRGEGARLALLTLNRGEAGANAIGMSAITRCSGRASIPRPWAGSARPSRPTI